MAAGGELTSRYSNKKSFSISDWRWMSIELEKGDLKSSDDDDGVPDDCSQASSELLHS
jgi:hypothetical protein